MLPVLYKRMTCSDYLLCGCVEHYTAEVSVSFLPRASRRIFDSKVLIDSRNPELSLARERIVPHGRCGSAEGLKFAMILYIFIEAVAENKIKNLRVGKSDYIWVYADL